MEILEIKNFPENQNVNLSVLVNKKQPDSFFNGNCKLPIFSMSGVKRVASFECESTGDLILTVVSPDLSKKVVGEAVLPISDFLDHRSNLYVDKWVDLKTKTKFGGVDSKPIYLRVATSFTTPVPAPHLLFMEASRMFSFGSCFSDSKGFGPRRIRGSTSFFDDYGNRIVSIKMRYLCFLVDYFFYFYKFESKFVEKKFLIKRKFPI